MILVLDNHDSFVHNLARYLRRRGAATRVIRSDAIDVAGCEALQPTAIVLSPGPKRPEQAGCCLELIRRLGPTIPILGVCLGHQAIGEALGAQVVQVPPLHGSASDIVHADPELFAGCPQPLRVGRYHSLAIDPASVPDDLRITARTLAGDGIGDGGGEIVMAVRHRHWPLLGVQFHPESVLTAEGQRLIDNFLGIARRWASAGQRPLNQRQPLNQWQPLDQRQLVP